MGSDVAIVGAGPAGSALAILLARAGLSVRLVDRERFPRDKVCGDFLSPRCLPILERLGVLDEVAARAGTEIAGMRLFSPAGREVVARYGLVAGLGPGLGIARQELDVLLVEQARDAGAKVELGTRVDPLALDAGLVVGADGRGSRVARAFGIAGTQERAGGYALRAYLPAGPGLDAMGEIHLTSWGYVGLGPIGRGLVNTTIVVKTGRRVDMASTLGSVPTLRGKLASFAPKDVRALAPLRSGPRAVVDGTALLVGDAAMQLDPITGEGVYHALRSAELAAAAVPGALQGSARREALQGYARAHEAEFGPRRRFSRLLQRLLPRSAATELAGLLLPVAPRFTARAIAVAGNVVPARRLLG